MSRRLEEEAPLKMFLLFFLEFFFLGGGREDNEEQSPIDPNSWDPRKKDNKRSAAAAEDLLD